MPADVRPVPLHVTPIDTEKRVSAPRAARVDTNRRALHARSTVHVRTDDSLAHIWVPARVALPAQMLQRRRAGPRADAAARLYAARARLIHLLNFL
jgi:hypothetical protein